MTYPQLIFAVVMGIIVGLVLSGVIVFASVPTPSIPVEKPLPVDTLITEPIAMTSGFELVIVLVKIISIVVVASIVFALLSRIGLIPNFGDPR